MSHFADLEFKELVRSKTDIVGLISESVTLQPQRGGREFVGLCPFHDDHNPSMKVHPERQSFKCWSCDTGGDCFAYVMKRENVGFPEALEMLARRANLEMPKFRRSEPSDSGENKNRLYEIVAWAENEFHDCLLKSPIAQRARHYLQDRGISGTSISRFRLGYHPDDWQWLIERARGKYTPSQLVTVKLAGQREGSEGFFDYFADRLMFPIRDTQKRPVAFGGRILPDSKETGMGKYWNSPESILFQKSRLLYALDHARESISRSRTAVVVEGYTDCIMAHQHGLTNFVATLGTALNDSHVTNLKRLAERVVLVFDGDGPGRLAAEKALPRFLAQEIDLRILTLPDSLDPADFLAQRGPEQMIPILDGAIEAWEQKLRLTQERHGLASIDARHRVLNDMLEVLSQVPFQAGVGLPSSWQMRENVILGRLSQELKISETMIRERLSELRTAGQQRTGTKTAVNMQDDNDAAMQRPVSPSFPQNPTRDELAERELIEILFTLPEQAERIRAEISPSAVTNSHLRELLEICFQLQDQGVLPTYEKVTARLEDAGLKGLAAEVDWHAREVGISNLHVEHTLSYFRDCGLRRESAGLGGPHLAGAAGNGEAPDDVDQSARERLRQKTELHRKLVSRTTLN